ncbi:MAG: T9SS type A sorting domain-containing protein [Saprospiraceae bacterium]|nr:MAG: hypothetical protein UZ09_BCD002001725 [Bacteroidetes bacterium OLB9]MCO6463125.1 T9SS type A sorting domain-containing protein [Saprospiraceae bacterium]MCZ2337886.1 T9SS type A sorting domain-containing protein [Chitinophagales bacterium]
MKHIYLFILSYWVTTSLTAQEGFIPYPDRHSTSLTNQWLSCKKSLNPNTLRDSSYWIMYDLGAPFELNDSKIWNFNTPERINSYNNEPWSLTPLIGSLKDGMKEVAFDISIDGQTWQEVKIFEIPEASGSSYYEGVDGPDFEGVKARYLLLTGLSNHGGKCYGLGEIKVNISEISTTTQDLVHAQRLSIEPNPAKDKAMLVLNGYTSSEAIIKIVDIHGRVYQSFNRLVSSEKEKISISVASFPSGLYFVQVVQNGHLSTIKMEVIH